MRSSSVDVPMEDGSISTRVKPKVPWKEMGQVEKEASVHEERSRMLRLPRNATYVTHRLRVLDKILQLLSRRELYHKIKSWNCFLRGCLYEPKPLKAVYQCNLFCGIRDHNHSALGSM